MQQIHVKNRKERMQHALDDETHFFKVFLVLTEKSGVLYSYIYGRFSNVSLMYVKYSSNIIRRQSDER